MAAASQVQIYVILSCVMLGGEATLGFSLVVELPVSASSGARGRQAAGGRRTNLLHPCQLDPIRIAPALALLPVSSSWFWPPAALDPTRSYQDPIAEARSSRRMPCWRALSPSASSSASTFLESHNPTVPCGCYFWLLWCYLLIFSFLLICLELIPFTELSLLR